MRIESSQLVHIEQLALKADLNTLKQLSQAERKALQAMMKALQNGQNSVDIKGFGDSRMEALAAKLQLRVQKAPSGTVERMGKGIANLLHLRVSSSKLQQELGSVKDKYERLGEIGKRIKSCEDDIRTFVDILRFTDEFARPTYDRLANFYRELPNEQSEAIPLIKELKNKIAEEIQALRNSKDPEKADKLHILEKEIFSNLRKMEKYQGKDWSGELKTNREVWGRTVQQTRQQPMTKSAIEDKQKLLSSLINEHAKLEGELGLGIDKRRGSLDKQIASHRNLIEKDKGEIELLRAVPIRLGAELQIIWYVIALGPTYTFIIDKKLGEIETRIQELETKDNPLDKARLASLKELREELKHVRELDPEGRKEVAEKLKLELSSRYNDAQEKMSALRSEIFKREMAIEHLEAKKR